MTVRATHDAEVATEARIERADLRELEASIPPPACEHRVDRDAPTCGVRAGWLLVLSCGHAGYVCPTHRDAMQRHLAAGARCGNAPHAPLRPDWHFETV